MVLTRGRERWSRSPLNHPDAQVDNGQVTDLPDGRQDIAPRSTLSRLAFALRVLAIVFFSIALATEHGLRWVLIAGAVGLLIVPLAFRRKAAPVAGALWSASAELLQGSKHFPGELSITTDTVVWNPSTYSRHHGFEQVTAQLGESGGVRLESGPALLDVFVDVRVADGKSTRFLTHRSPGLRRAIRQTAG